MDAAPSVNDKRNLVADQRTPAQVLADRARAIKARGNTNKRMGDSWRRALRMAVYEKDVRGVRALARIAKRIAEDAEARPTRDNAAVIVAARREIGERLDGRPVSQVNLGGTGTPIQIVATRDDTGAL